MRFTIALVVLFFNCLLVSAQNTVPTKSDTVYKKIDGYTKQTKFGKLVHKLFFKPIATTPTIVKKKKRGISTIQKSFNKYNCLTIRNIKIVTLDPFGYSAEDANEIPTKKIERLGNILHLKTKNWTIRNLLLFKKYDQLDSLLVKESERLIRKQRYVRSVEIKPIPIENSIDSIDVSVRVLDTWTTIPTGAFSNSKANLELSERNFFGLGHEFDLNYIKSFTTNTVNTFAYDSKYTISNIKNTFITTSVGSRTDLNNNTYKFIKFDRPFYSTFTHWAGGIYYNYSSFSELLPDANAVLALQNYKLKTYEFWGAHSFKLLNGESEFARSTHLVFAVGFTNAAYLVQPSITYDPIQFFSSFSHLLGSIGITSQKFYQDRYLFRFGTVEDIPYGKTFSVTGGVQTKNNVARAYFGSRFSYGDYFDFGYLQGNIEIGSYFSNGNSEQTTIKLEANYFTPLFSIGKWKFRQFVKPVLVLGNNRLNTLKDRLNLIDVNGIPGFNSSPLYGTNKFVATFQMQSYNPKNWYGFNMSPFLNISLGFLDDGSYTFLNNKMYSQIGLGVLVNNKYLVFNSFQFSLSYYPSLPIDGSTLIKSNAFQNSDIQFRDFQIGQPYAVPYQ